MNEIQKTPADQIKLPAVGIIVVGILGLVSALYSALNVVFGFTASFVDSFDLPPEVRQAVGAASSYEFVGMIVNAVGSTFLVWAGLRMIKLRGHTAALVASILALIPCWGGCCCLGTIAGIWALIVLLKPEVKQAFDAQ